jgi:hypothetical protein
MCAWITGRIGECEVGTEFAELASKELSEETDRWFDMNSIRLCDDGCWRPCSTWGAPGKKRGPDLSVAIFFDKRPPPNIIEEMKVRAHSFSPMKSWIPAKINITGFRMIKQRLISEEETI